MRERAYKFLHFQIQSVTLAWDALLLCPPLPLSLPLLLLFSFFFPQNKFGLLVQLSIS